MPRPARCVLPPLGVYHVTARGVAKQAIVRDDFDRRYFRRQLNLARARHHWLVYAWCLMTNHFHLVVVCDLERLSRGMHNVFDNPVRAGLCERRTDWPWLGGEVLADLG
jgi:putative transposase